MFHNSKFRKRNFTREFGQEQKGGRLLLEWIVFRIDWNNNRDDGNWLKMVDTGC